MSLLTACLAFGLGEALVTSSSAALVADVSRQRRLGSAMAVFGTIADVGHASGPILAGLLVKADAQGAVVKDSQGRAQLVVERRFVETGERRDGQVLVLKGLKAGEQVVTAGQLKLDNGAHVAIVEDQAQVLK